jgi:hypothetical protein
MSKTSLVAGGCCTPRPLPTFPNRPEPRPLPDRPSLPERPSLPGRPTLPPGGLDQFLTRSRSSQLANAQGNQLDRIEQGVANGTISEKEAAKLLDQQARIANEVSRASADGVITAAEQAKIRQMQLGASLGIHQATSSRELSSFTRDPSLAQAQANQVGQIADGIRSGALSGREASSLLTGQANISRQTADARADGKVDLSERLRLGLAQSKAGRDIQRESSDFEKAPHGRLPIFRPKFPTTGF